MASLCATGSRIACRPVRLFAPAAGCAPADAAELVRDDCPGFPPGWLSRPLGQLGAAIQEDHALSHCEVPLGPWDNAIFHLDAWTAGQEEGKAYLEQPRSMIRSG